MNEDEIKRLEKLRSELDFAMRVCHPIEFQVRQHNLLLAIANFLIEPLEIYEKEQEQEKELE